MAKGELDYEDLHDFFERPYEVTERSDGSWLFTSTSDRYDGWTVELQGSGLSGTGVFPGAGTITQVIIKTPAGVEADTVGSLSLLATDLAAQFDFGDDDGDGGDDDLTGDVGDDDLSGHGGDDDLAGDDGDDDLSGGGGDDDLSAMMATTTCTARAATMISAAAAATITSPVAAARTTSAATRAATSSRARARTTGSTAAPTTTC